MEVLGWLILLAVLVPLVNKMVPAMIGGIERGKEQHERAALKKGGDMGALLLLALAAGYLSEVPAAAQTAADSPPPAAANVPAARKTDPRDAWAAVAARLDQADRESAESVESQLARVNEFFTERKQGARPFAEAVLGTEGKLQATGGLIEGAASALGELFGNKPATGPDSFTIYVRRSFRRHVLDAGQLEKAIDSAVAGYGGEIRRLEGRLLVDLRADLDDAGFDVTRALPEIRAGAAAAGQGDAMISQAVEAAAADYSAMIVKFAVSTVISNEVADRLTKDGDSRLKKFGINIAAGVAVDKVLDEAVARAGYDPEGALAAKVTSSLDRMRVLLVDGWPQAAQHYSALCAFRDGYPNEAIRAACREAATVIERSPSLGLRHQLLALHAERSRLRAAALRKFVFGPDAPAAESAAPARIDPKKSSPPAQILQFARQCRDYYGAQKP